MWVGKEMKRPSGLKRKGSANASSSQVSFEKPERVRWRPPKERERAKDRVSVSYSYL